MHIGKFFRSHTYTNVLCVYYFHFLDYWQTVLEKKMQMSVTDVEFLGVLTQFFSAIIDLLQTSLY
jgi:hypothetical protein